MISCPKKILLSTSVLIGMVINKNHLQSYFLLHFILLL